jgi:hypothetical protein
VAHIIERAVTGRAKCRACNEKIAAGERRFGERVPNPFGDEGTETTHWYHVPCAAFTRPESFLDALPTIEDAIDDRDRLEREARLGAAHHRLPRVRAAEHAPTGRATCRSCRQPIAKGDWRFALAFYEDGRFSPSGYIHANCAAPYLETTDVEARIRHFSPSLSDADVVEIRDAMAAPPA